MSGKNRHSSLSRQHPYVLAMNGASPPRSGGDSHLLYIRQEIEVFVVLVLAAFAFSQQLLGGDELDALDPFDHFVAELVFDAEPERRAVDLGEPAAVHVGREQ